MKRRVLAAAVQLVRVQRPDLVGIKDANVCAVAGVQASQGQAQGLCRAMGEAGDGRGQVENAFFHQFQAQGQQGFQPGNARGGEGERLGFGVFFMGLVVGADDPDVAAGDRLAQDVAVGLGAKGRIHMTVGVEAVHVGIQKKQLVDGDVCGQFCAALPCLANHLDGAAGGQGMEMAAAVRMFGQGQVPRHGHGFRCRGNARQSQAAGDAALVYAAVAFEVRVFAAQNYREIEGAGVLQGVARHQGIGHALAGIADGNAACLFQCAHFRQLFPGQISGQRANRQHPGVAAGFRPAADEFPDSGGVDDRIGIRHADQGGDAAAGGRFGFAANGALVFFAGLAQMYAQIDEPRTHDLAPGIDGLVDAEAVGFLAHCKHPAMLEVQVEVGVDAIGRIDQASAPDMQVYRDHESCSPLLLPMAMDITAMRTAMP